MGDLLGILDAVSGWSWGWLLVAFLAALTLESWPHLQYHFWQWRINRAFRQRGELFQDELRDYEWKQGEEPEAFNVGRVLAASLQSALQLFLPVVLADAVSDEDLILVPAASMAAAWFAQGRQAEEEDRAVDDEPGGYDVPAEAKAGFVAAVGMLAVIVLVIFTFG